ncbi:hypothetical protein [Paenibacillus sp.]|uniref:hypothetical protein n=1 Tax=Paenibacillus sp. TaxID=58172 RepID=UPI0028B1ED07|nr:hypothetical protein [Paenibacillus sp.]
MEFKYGNGQKAYLSAIKDLHDKSIVAYVLGHANNNSLVFKTLELDNERLQAKLNGLNPIEFRTKAA